MASAAPQAVRLLPDTPSHSEMRCQDKDGSDSTLHLLPREPGLLQSEERTKHNEKVSAN